MTRIILGLLAGIVAAFAVVAAGEAIGHTIYPPPPGADPQNPEAMKTLIATLPNGAIAAVLLSWAAGAFIGGGVAAYIARRDWAAMALGAVVLVSGAITMNAIPHPIWFTALSVPATLLPAWLAGRCFAHGGETSANAT
jgi:hypothetical protein